MRRYPTTKIFLFVKFSFLRYVLDKRENVLVALFDQLFKLLLVMRIDVVAISSRFKISYHRKYNRLFKYKWICVMRRWHHAPVQVQDQSMDESLMVMIVRLNLSALFLEHRKILHECSSRYIVRRWVTTGQCQVIGFVAAVICCISTLIYYIFIINLYISLGVWRIFCG